MNCCEKCIEAGFGEGELGCRKRKCPCHTTSPEKNWEAVFTATWGVHEECEGMALFEVIAFITRTLDNQKKQVLAVLEGMKRSNVVTEPDSRCPAFNEALTEAITKITNL